MAVVVCVCVSQDLWREGNKRASTIREENIARKPPPWVGGDVCRRLCCTEGNNLEHQLVRTTFEINP